MLHLPIQIIIVMIIEKLNIDRTIFDHPLALLLYLSIVILIGKISYTHLEMPAQKYIRFRYLK
jgi:hypothetical protein